MVSENCADDDIYAFVVAIHNYKSTQCNVAILHLTLHSLKNKNKNLISITNKYGKFQRNKLTIIIDVICIKENNRKAFS